MTARPRTSRIWTQLNDDEFRELVTKSYSISDILRFFGPNYLRGGSRRILQKRIDELNIDTSHIAKGMGWRSIRLGFSNPQKYDLDDILVGKHSEYKPNRLKHRLYEAGLKQRICEECGLDEEWNGKPITLQLDHVDGNSTNHLLDNLKILCPNCHSQTDTFAGRNVKTTS